MFGESLIEEVSNAISEGGNKEINVPLDISWAYPAQKPLLLNMPDNYTDSKK